MKYRYYLKFYSIYINFETYFLHDCSVDKKQTKLNHWVRSKEKDL